MEWAEILKLYGPQAIPWIALAYLGKWHMSRMDNEEAERAEQVAKTAANEACNDFYRRMAKVVADQVRAEEAKDPVAEVKADMQEEIIWAEIDKWNKAHPEDYLQVRLDRKSARRNLVKEFEGADYDKGARKQARGEIDKLRQAYGRQ